MLPTSLLSLVLVFLFSIAINAQDFAGRCKIQVLDRETQQPVPLIELRTTGELRFVSDNAGVIAFDAVELMGQSVWFHVHGHGYSVKPDGFGMRGVRLRPTPNETLTVYVDREIIAQRLGRLTGKGLFAESQQLGEYLDEDNSPLVGCDSVQMVVYQNQLFWNWGDTNVVGYPLGNFHMTGAFSDLSLFSSLQLPLRPSYRYLVKPDGNPRPIAPIEGKGPTWLTGYVALADQKGNEHLVAIYRKIEPPLDTYELGRCEWDDQRMEFVRKDILWRKADGQPAPQELPEGHPARWIDEAGRKWVLFGNPFPQLRIPDEYEAWLDRNRWETLEPPKELKEAGSGRSIKPHSGSIGWSPYRGSWVTIFMQYFGNPSPFGELWYAEAASPLGPWSAAVKVLSHDNYTFYNPRVHTELGDPSSSSLIFEGTYTRQFAKNPFPTPRYDYNQILYRIDLNDPRLLPASTPAR